MKILRQGKAPWERKYIAPSNEPKKVQLTQQMWSVRRTSPSRVSLLLGTEPLWAAAVGIALGGERLGVLGLLGAVLVLAGTAWGRRRADAAA